MKDRGLRRQGGTNGPPGPGGPGASACWGPADYGGEVRREKTDSQHLKSDPIPAPCE